VEERGAGFAGILVDASPAIRAIDSEELCNRQSTDAGHPVFVVSLAVGQESLAASRKKAIFSFRLRLHSGLRQSGSACGAVFIVTAKAVTYLFSPHRTVVRESGG
jgi:hypothetical protein